MFRNKGSKKKIKRAGSKVQIPGRREKDVETRAEEEISEGDRCSSAGIRLNLSGKKLNRFVPLPANPAQKEPQQGRGKSLCLRDNLREQKREVRTAARTGFLTSELHPKDQRSAQPGAAAHRGDKSGAAKTNPLRVLGDRVEDEFLKVFPAQQGRFLAPSSACEGRRALPAKVCPAPLASARKSARFPR